MKTILQGVIGFLLAAVAIVITPQYPILFVVILLVIIITLIHQHAKRLEEGEEQQEHSDIDRSPKN
jgi:UDP-N-acetylmuramyl pentapeptide phosphotransferase/UDP-N-acetylglucosamine-1-phosphate transferase